MTIYCAHPYTAVRHELGAYDNGLQHCQLCHVRWTPNESPPKVIIAYGEEEKQS